MPHEALFAVRFTAAQVVQVRYRDLGEPSVLTLLTNLVMPWNTQYLQQRVSAADASQKPLLNAAMAHVSAALFSHINFKGRFDFPMARYRARLIGEDVSRATLATGEMR